MSRKEAKYLKEYKNLSMLEKLKYNLSRDLFTGAPPKKIVGNFQITFFLIFFNIFGKDKKEKTEKYNHRHLKNKNSNF